MRMWLAAAVVLLAIQTAPARADRDPQSGAPRPVRKQPAASPLTDRFYIRASYYSAQLRTNLRVDPSNAAPGTLGTPFNAEHDLGLPERDKMGRVEFSFRLRERSKVRVDYLEVNRSGSQVLANDLVFGNSTFTAGSLTQSSLSWQQFDITYTYSFVHTSRFEVGTGLGIYFLEVDAISQTAGPILGLNQREEVSAATPFPALPLDVVWRISNRWSVTAQGAYLRANLSGFHGWYADSHEDLQYRLKPNFTLGIGYSSTRTSLTRKGGTFPGAFAMSISGPEAFIRISF